MHYNGRISESFRKATAEYRVGVIYIGYLDECLANETEFKWKVKHSLLLQGQYPVTLLMCWSRQEVTTRQATCISRITRTSRMATTLSSWRYVPQSEWTTTDSRLRFVWMTKRMGWGRLSLEWAQDTRPHPMASLPEYSRWAAYNLSENRSHL